VPQAVKAGHKTRAVGEVSPPNIGSSRRPVGDGSDRIQKSEVSRQRGHS
jgi:hypothetical protein